MGDESAVVAQRQALGAWMRKARLEAGRSLADSAAPIGCSTKMLSSFESGDKSPTLPQMEALAELYRVPVSYFWQAKDAPEAAGVPAPSADLVKQRMLLRQKLIGVQLRKARQCAGKSLKESGSAIGASSRRVNQYECGEREVPVDHLAALASLYGAALEEFVMAPEVRRAPVSADAAASASAAEAGPRASAIELGHLSPELREFVSKPTNTLYLEVAMRLSRLSVADLRAVAESLLEITY